MIKKIISLKQIYLIVILVLVDEFSKIIINNSLSPGEIIGIFPFFSITSVKNYGISFNIFTDKPFLIFLLTMLSFILLFYLLHEYSYRKLMQYAIVIIIAGAIGNFLNRIFLGYVIDFFQISFFNWNFPIFNCADVYISIGFLLILLDFYLENRRGS